MNDGKDIKERQVSRSQGRNQHDGSAWLPFHHRVSNLREPSDLRKG